MRYLASSGVSLDCVGRLLRSKQFVPTMTATEYLLKLVDWQFFATFTWSEANLGSCRRREQQVWEFLRGVAQRHGGKRLAQLPIALRWEKGEHGDRPHAHALLGGLPGEKVNKAFCYMIAGSWGKDYGFGRWRTYDYHQQAETAETYLQKMRGSVSQANQYEVGKFDRADRLIINEAAWRQMCKAQGTAYRPQLLTA